MPKLAIRQQIMVLAILPFLLITGGTSLFLLNSYLNEVHHLDEASAQRSARLLARHLAAALRTDSEGRIDDLLTSSLDRELLGAGLLGMNGDWLARRGQVREPDLHQPEGKRPEWQESELTAVWPVYPYDHTALPPQTGQQPSQLGWAVVTASHNHFLQARYTVIAISLLWLLLMLLLVVYLGGRLTRNFDNSINQMRQLLSTLDQHDWSTRLPDSRNRDWQALFSAMNELAHRNQQRLRNLQNEIEHSHQDLQKTLENLEISNIELALAREEALSASQSKSEFLANTSHEVRTPLSGILGFCHVLLESESNPRRREYIDTIKTSAEHLLRVLNDILDLSKIEAGKFSLQHQPFALLPVIEESAGLFAQQAADKGIALIVDAEEPLPRQVLGDSARLKQLATNLISNAIKFTDHGQVLVALSAGHRDGETVEICLSVSDTGAGIPLQEQAKLFQAFQQLDGTDTRQHGGTGLGLAVVKRLVELMSGSVQVTSEPGHGASFEVRLPLTLGSQSAPVAARKQRVYFWEENPDARRALRRRLHANGYSSQTHSTLLELLAAAPQDAPVIAGFTDYTSFTRLEAQLATRTNLIVLLPSLAQVMARQDHVFLQQPVAEHKLMQALAGEHRSEGKHGSQAASVLVVDDNQSNRLLLSALLDQLDVNATLCDNGREAAALCNQHTYPLIILDLQMPDMNGEDTARAIRESTLNHNSYLVALSAYLPDSEASSSALFDDIMLKPMTLSALSELLHRSGRKGGAISGALGIERADSNPELARLLLKRFLLSLEDCRKEWQRAISDQARETLASLAHQLLGACRYVGTPELEALLEKLQEEIKHTHWSEAWQSAAACVATMDELLHWHANHEPQDIIG